MPTYKTTEIKRNIHHIDFDHDIKDVPFLLISDVHFDSVKCDRALLTQHFKVISEQQGYVIVNGDWFDLMQGKYDPRGSKYDIRPEYNRGDYIDSVIRDSAEWLAQWKVPVFIGQGNHETSILRRLETNPTERLVTHLKYLGVEASLGGYSGWIVLRSRRKKKAGDATNNYVVNYHHGHGGNAARSKGILKADINQMQYPDADLIIRGHDHNKWLLPQTVYRLNASSTKESKRIIHHLQTGSYKGQGDRYAGWETEKGFSTTTLGGWYLYLNHIRGAVEYMKPKFIEAS
jgi:predicted phosphodiesterase